MKRQHVGVILGAMLMAISVASFAANQGTIVNNPNAYRYQVLTDKNASLYPPRPQRPIPPHHKYPPVLPSHPPIQNGVNIQYRAPTTIYQNSNSYTWVSGDPNVARLESSNYVLITDWKSLGLPAPPTGTYWILENGRYVLVPND
ncbi:hypothetical protein A3K93_02020 [Acinetobacter sp. NCu2D-2]|uniref:RcnB family protein n=1 Tax=Acinetobacter sp. NCu2D-2 TaxID=1608473 RepID=UPI0007CDECDA|nr:RcnB family protein [Acinetobacter sp. NCu2D-2]ANF81091.1 hypothetical protein A3K93_02020 [Acinetobacter sp. NCu2D-2]